MMIQNQSYCFSGIVTLYLLFLISLILHTLASPTPTLHYCRRDQRDALLEFKQEFPVHESDPSMGDVPLTSWNKSTDCCSWIGVKCDAKSGKVISLSFIFISLNNSFKPNSGLFKLQYLQNLTFYNCDLYGEIPSSLGNLSSLTHLELTQNKLVGPLPASIGKLTQLKYLMLSGNSFSGKIPNSFANLTKLSLVNLDNNYFESTLPPDMSGFHSLDYISLSANSFFGSFPSSLFTIPSLRYVNLKGNQFNGPIELRNSSSRLQYLNIAYNKLNGSIPSSISKFHNLVELDISHNNFVDPIPISMSTLVKLKYIDLSYNKFEGQVPGYLWELSNVMLSHNSFNSCEKTSKVVNQTQIQALGLASNSFRGPFPYWICKFKSLLFLDLSNNSFNGSIPRCLRNFIATLEVLVLHNNNFNEILPDIFLNATNLLSFDVSNNQLEGKLPKSLINCKALKFLNVESNNINETFPFWLESLPWLQVLILKSNKFYGPLYHPHVSVGFQSIRVIDISHNDFIGTLPPFYFSNWHEMTRLSEEHVDGVFIVNDPYMDEGLHFHTIYSNSMELVHKGVNTEFERIRKDFRAMDFSGNRFHGNIPESIGLLKGLLLLNLSRNTFTSSIPGALANLTSLEALDLSQNQFSGQIPRDLGSLSFLSTMNFSHNNLEGPIPRGTQFQRQNCSSFMDNPKLHGLEDICEETHVPYPSQEPDDLMSEPKEQVMNWIAAAIAYGPGVLCGLVIGHIFASHKQEWFMEKFGRNKPRAAI